jgi:hypothetical protein
MMMMMMTAGFYSGAKVTEGDGGMLGLGSGTDSGTSVMSSSCECGMSA